MNIASMISRYNRYQKRKSVISSDDSLISASDLSKEWGLSYIATCEEIKRLRIPLAFNIANEKFYDRETCNKKMPFLSECKIIKPEKKEAESMDKKEELQKWLDDDRYVQRKELAIMWNVGGDGVRSFLRGRKIKKVKTLSTRQGIYAFYDKQQCVNARAAYNAKIQELQNWSNNTKFIQIQELALKWGITVAGVSSFLHIKNIRSIKRINIGFGGNYAFYDRAECERARPFINQPEKEVEKVEKDQKIESTQLGGIFCGDIAIGKFAIASSASDVLILKKVAGDIICPVLSVSTPDKNYDYIKKIIGKNICLVMIEDSEPDHKSVMYWLDLPGASPWIIPIKYGKNITEAHKNGVIIREFIEA